MNLWTRLTNLNWREIKISDVILGCTNYYFGDIINTPEQQEKLKKIIAYRLNICNNCIMNSNQAGVCDNSGNIMIPHTETGQLVSGCGCNLACKAAEPNTNCPAAKWKAVKI